MRQLKISHQITSRTDISVDKYLLDVSRIPLINSDEEVELIKRIKTGDQVAFDKLINANLRFVVSVAKQYQNQGLSLSDLINEGNIGLIKAARRFDETRGFKFISYGVWWIRQSILQALADNSRLIRLPLNKVGALTKVNNAVQLLEQRLQREPSVEELAKFLEITEAQVAQSLRSRKRPISMDAPLQSDGMDGGTMYDVLQNSNSPSPDSPIMGKSLKDELYASLGILSDREVTVLSQFYGLFGEAPKSLEDIGHNISLTKERVRQIRESALVKLKKKRYKDPLTNYI
jgi:RNA polymerase primary sigma factor